MHDLMREVLDGTDPDRVLVRVRNAEGVTLATRKDYGRPIDYLRYRVKKPDQRRDVHGRRVLRWRLSRDQPSRIEHASDHRTSDEGRALHR
jgi:hypothetical protein